MLTCDALAFKSVSIFGVILSASGIIFPISYTVSSIISYLYGFERCKRSIFFMLLAQLFFCTTVSLFSNISIDPNYEDKGISSHYLALYGPLWKVIFSSSIAVYVSMYINSLITSKLKIYFNNGQYLFSIIAANLVSQLVLVIISYSINFSHILTSENIVKIIVSTYIYKIIVSSSITLFFSKTLYKISLFIDKIDNYDVNVRYSSIPFVKNNFGINKYDNK